MNVEADARVRFVACDDAATWIVRAVEVIGNSLARSLDRNARARLLLSGGSTPVPVYTSLGATDLEWSRVDIGLVDERDVAADDAGSNARLVRESLVAALEARGAPAHFHALRERDAELVGAVAAANADTRVDPAGAVVVLGMGDDGHTASLFPGSVDLAHALAEPRPYAMLDASGCAGAGRWPRRLSLTRRGLDAASARILLLRGAGKRAVFERALAAGPRDELPIRYAIDAQGPALDVIWSRD